jgi:beta-lactamase class A
MQYSDVQAYGTGVLLYTYLIGYTMTLRECAEFLIKKSDNTAWKMLDRYLGRDYIRAELYRAGARSSQYWLPNTTTPNDVLLMLEKMSNRSYTPPTPSRKDAGLAQGRLLRQHLRPRRSDLSRRRDTKDAYFIEDAYFIVVMASETGWGTSRAATQEMSLATYRILSEPTPEGESNG